MEGERTLCKPGAPGSVIALLCTCDITLSKSLHICKPQLPFSLTLRESLSARSMASAVPGIQLVSWEVRCFAIYSSIGCRRRRGGAPAKPQTVKGSSLWGNTTLQSSLAQQKGQIQDRPIHIQTKQTWLFTAGIKIKCCFYMKGNAK